ncbi:MAG: transposase [Candidatus Omnitrophica bacterium]|nr:transposase [Candidatus Omnitrophota bacterium]
MPGNRKSIRLKDYDYAQQGAYYVTVCANDRECVFGDVRNGKMVLNGAGDMVTHNWNKLPDRFPNIKMDEFIVMPNHLHGVIVIVGKTGDVGAPLVGALNDVDDRAGPRSCREAGTRQRAPIKGAPTVGEIIGAFKSLTTNEYIRNVRINNWPSFNKQLWQRNFYEHVIRTESDLTSIREYIINNPSQWEDDEYFFPNPLSPTRVKFF